MLLLTPKRALTGILLSALAQYACYSAYAQTSGPDPALRTYLTANGLLNRGLNELAVEEYRSFLSANANHEKAASARYGLSVALFRQQKFEDALKELDPLSKTADFEFAAEVAVMRGQCYLTSGNYEKAISAFEAVPAGDGKSELADDAAAGLIESFYRAGKFDEVRREAPKFTTTWADSSLGDRVELFAGLAEMAQSDFAAASERFAAYRQKYSGSPYNDQVLLLLAQCCHQSGQSEAAIEHYRGVLKQKGGQHAAEALLGLGVLLQRAQKYEAAAEVLDQLIKKFPEAAFIGKGYFSQGEVAFAREQYGAAYESFRKAAEKDKELSDQSAYWMAKCQLREGKAEAAAETLAAAASEFAQSELGAEMAYDRAVALLRAGKPDEALATLRDFPSKFPDHALTPDVLHLLAGTEHQKGEYEASTKHCAEFLKAYARHQLAPAVAFLWAENAFLSKDYSKAAERYRAFLNDFAGSADADKARLRLGLALYRMDDGEGALQELSQVEALASKQPLFLPAILTIGDIYFSRSEWKRAEEYLHKYVKHAANANGIDDVLFKIAYAQQRQGRMDEAIPGYERVVKEFHDSPHRLQAIFETAQMLVSRNKQKEAAKLFEQVLVDGGDDSRFANFALNHLAAIASQEGNSQAAAGYYARAAKSSGEGDDAAIAQLRQAESLIAAGEFKQAEDVLRRLLSSNATFAQANEAKAQLAIALARLERHEEALALISEVESKSEEVAGSLRASLQYEKAWALRKSGNEQAAAETYEKLLSLNPPADLLIHVLLESAELAMKAKELSRAESMLRRLAEELTKAAKDQYAVVREQCAYQLGACAFEQGNHKGAADAFGDFIRNFPESKQIASALYFAGESHFQAGRHEKAIENLAQIAEKHPSSDVAGPALLRLGECNAALQRWPASEKAFADYLARFPGTEVWYQAQFGVAWARENQKQYDDAIREYQKVVGKHDGPTAARAQFQIGECLFAKGAYEEAVRELLKVDILYAYPQWSAAATFEAGRCFQKMGKPAEAKAQFQTVLDKFKDSEWSKSASQHIAEAAKAAELPGLGNSGSH